MMPMSNTYFQCLLSLHITQVGFVGAVAAWSADSEMHLARTRLRASIENASRLVVITHNTVEIRETTKENVIGYSRIDLTVQSQKAMYCKYQRAPIKPHPKLRIMGCVTMVATNGKL